MGSINIPTSDAPSVSIPGQPQFLTMPQLIFMPPNGHLGMLAGSSASVYPGATSIVTQPAMSSQSSQPTSISLTQAAIPSTVQPQGNQLTMAAMPATMVTTFMGKKMRAIAPKPMRNLIPKVAMNVDSSLPIETVNLTPELPKKKPVASKSKKKKESPAKVFQSLPQVTQTAAPTYLQIPHAATSQSILSTSTSYIPGGQPQPIITYPQGFMSTNMAPVQYTQSLPSYPASSTNFIQPQALVSQQSAPQIVQPVQSEGTTIVQETEVVNLTADDDILALAWQNVNDCGLSFLNPSNAFDQTSFQFPQGEDPLDTFLRSVDGCGADAFPANPTNVIASDQKPEETNAKSKSKKAPKRNVSLKKGNDNGENGETTIKKPPAKRKTSTGNKKSSLDKLENGVQETVVVDLQAMTSEANSQLANEAIQSIGSLASDLDMHIDLLKFTSEDRSVGNQDTASNVNKEQPINSQPVSIETSTEKAIYSSLSSDQFFEDLAKLSPNNTLNEQSCADFLDELTKQTDSEIANDQEACAKLLQELEQDTPELVVSDKKDLPQDTSPSLSAEKGNEQVRTENSSPKNQDIIDVTEKSEEIQPHVELKPENDAVQTLSTYEITDTQSLEEMEQFLLDQLKETDGEAVNAAAIEENCSDEQSKTELIKLPESADEVNENSESVPLDDDEFLSSLDVSFSNDNALNSEDVSSSHENTAGDQRIQMINALRLISNAELSDGISPIKQTNNASWDRLDHVLKTCQRQLAGIDDSLSSSNTTSSSSKMAASDLCDQHSENLPTDESYSHLFEQSSERINISDCSAISDTNAVPFNKQTVEIFSSSPAKPLVSLSISKTSAVHTDSSEDRCLRDDDFALKPRRGLPTSRRKRLKDSDDKANDVNDQTSNSLSNNDISKASGDDNETIDVTGCVVDDITDSPNNDSGPNLYAPIELEESISVNDNSTNMEVDILDKPPTNPENPTNDADSAAEKQFELETISQTETQHLNSISEDSRDEPTVTKSPLIEPTESTTSNRKNGFDPKVVDLVCELTNSGALEITSSELQKKPNSGQEDSQSLDQQNEESDKGEFLQYSESVMSKIQSPNNLELDSRIVPLTNENQHDDKSDAENLFKENVDMVPSETDNQSSLSVAKSFSGDQNSDDLKDDALLLHTIPTDLSQFSPPNRNNDADADDDDLPLALLSRRLSNDQPTGQSDLVHRIPTEDDSHSPPKLTRHKKETKKRKKTKSKLIARRKTEIMEENLMPCLESLPQSEGLEKEEIDCIDESQHVDDSVNEKVLNTQKICSTEETSPMDTIIVNANSPKHVDVCDTSENLNNNTIAKSTKNTKKKKSSISKRGKKSTKKVSSISGNLKSPLSILVEECASVAPSSKENLDEFNEKCEKGSSCNSLVQRNGPLFDALQCSPIFNTTVGFQNNLPVKISPFGVLPSSKSCESNFGKIANNLPTFGDIKPPDIGPSVNDPSLDAVSNVFPSFGELKDIKNDAPIESNPACWYNHKGSILPSPNQILFSDAEKLILETAARKQLIRKPLSSKKKKGGKKKLNGKSSNKKKIAKIVPKEDPVEIIADKLYADSVELEEVEEIPDTDCSEKINFVVESSISSAQIESNNILFESVDSASQLEVLDCGRKECDLVSNSDDDDFGEQLSISDHQPVQIDFETQRTDDFDEVSKLTPVSSVNNATDDLPECNKENETTNPNENQADNEGSPEAPSSPLFPPELTQETMPEPEPLICVIPKLRIKKSKLKSKSKKKHRNKHHNQHHSREIYEPKLDESFKEPEPHNTSDFESATEVSTEAINPVTMPHMNPMLDRVSNHERPPYLPRLTMTLPTPRQLPKPAENTSPSLNQRKNKCRVAAGVATKKIFSTCKEDRRSSFAQMNNFLQFGKTAGRKAKATEDNSNPIPAAFSPNKSVSNDAHFNSVMAAQKMKRKRGRPKKLSSDECHLSPQTGSTMPENTKSSAADCTVTTSSQPPLKMRFKLSGQSNGYQVAIPSVTSANESGDEVTDTYRPQLSDHLLTTSHSRSEPSRISPVNTPPPPPTVPDFDFMVAGEAEVFVDPHQVEVERQKNRSYIKKHRLKHRDRHADPDHPDGPSKSKRKKHKHHHNPVYTAVEKSTVESPLTQSHPNTQPTVSHSGLEVPREPKSYSTDAPANNELSNNYHDPMHSQHWTSNLNQQKMTHAPPSPQFLQSPTGYSNTDNYSNTNYHQTASSDSPDKQIRSSHQSALSNWNNNSSLAFTSTPYPDKCGSSVNTAHQHSGNSLNVSRDSDCAKSDALLSPGAGPPDSCNVSVGRGSNGGGTGSQYSVPTPGYQPTPYQQEAPMSNRSMNSPLKLQQAHSVGSNHALQSPSYHHSNPSSVSTTQCPPSNHSAAREEIDVGGPNRESLHEPRLPDLSIEDSLPNVDHSNQSTAHSLRPHSTAETSKSMKTSSDNLLKSSRNQTPQPTNSTQSSSTFYNPAAFYNTPSTGLTRSTTSPGPARFSDWAASMYQAAAAQQHEAAAYSQLASLYQQNYANASLYPAAAALRAHQHQNAAAYPGGGAASTGHANPWDFYSSHNPLQAYSEYTSHSAAEMLAAHHLLSNNFSNPSSAVTSHQSGSHGARASPNMMMFGSTNPMLPMPAHQGSVSTPNSAGSSSSSMAAAAAVAAGFHPGFSMHNFPN